MRLKSKDFNALNLGTLNSKLNYTINNWGNGPVVRFTHGVRMTRVRFAVLPYF